MWGKIRILHGRWRRPGKSLRELAQTAGGIMGSCRRSGRAGLHVRFFSAAITLKSHLMNACKTRTAKLLHSNVNLYRFPLRYANYYFFVQEFVVCKRQIAIIRNQSAPKV